MKQAIMTVMIWAPLPLANTDAKPEGLARVTLTELCEIVGIPCRATMRHEIVLHDGEEHFYDLKTYYVGTQASERVEDRITHYNGSISRKMAFQILEVLAHGFHDPAARETVCKQELFRVPTLDEYPAAPARK